jgi:two-component system, OmpR family, alkaline phosphatase synthesis response regulator PhoP
MKILIAEDDPVSRRVLEATLSKWGFEVLTTSNGREAWEALVAPQAPKLAILDWMMPEMDGVEVCRRARGRPDAGPLHILLLTARGRKEDVIAGLQAGADDYITKPFDLEELLARIKVVLRRARPTLKRLTLGAVTIDFEALRAAHGAEDIHLSYREFDVLRYLAERRGSVVSRNELLSQIWSYADLPITRSVDHAIARLRKKIEPDPKHPRYIHTVHGDGYCLTPEGPADYVAARQGRADS